MVLQRPAAKLHREETTDASGISIGGNNPALIEVNQSLQACDAAMGKPHTGFSAEYASLPRPFAGLHQSNVPHLMRSMIVTAFVSSSRATFSAAA